MDISSKIYVAGHNGMVGSSLVRALKDAGHSNLLLRTRQELDLTDSLGVMSFFEIERPEYVFLAAAKVGGILANSIYKADFLLENLQIQNSVISAAHEFNVKKLLFLGSSCIYPKYADQPISEKSLFTGELEPTNDAYAVAKIAGIKLCQSYREQYGDDFICAMPTNLYGPNDNYDLETSHVVPALVRKFVEAKQSEAGMVEIWGSGNPKREFLHVDDLAKACLFLMENYSSEEIINVGVGKDLSIRELAILIQKYAGYEGELVFNTDRPDGTPRKVLDTSRINNLGWFPTIGLEEGLEKEIVNYQQSSSIGS